MHVSTETHPDEFVSAVGTNQIRRVSRDSYIYIYTTLYVQIIYNVCTYLSSSSSSATDYALNVIIARRQYKIFEITNSLVTEYKSVTNYTRRFTAGMYTRLSGKLVCKKKSSETPIYIREALLSRKLLNYQSFIIQVLFAS